MKKVLALWLSVLLTVSLCGCKSPSEQIKQEKQLEAISGSWSSEGEDLVISGNNAEFTGFYEYDGHRMAGTVTRGTLNIQPDGQFTIDMDGHIREGYVKDENTLVIGNSEFRR